MYEVRQSDKPLWKELMKYKISASLLALNLNAVAAQQNLDLPSCDLQGQREFVGEIGGKIIDTRQAHISARANVLSADIGTTRKARRITQSEAERMSKSIEEIRQQTDRFVEEQGFLSAAERASFDREFDTIAMQLCK